MVANYRAACRVRSKAEFFSKISIVVEETDETLFWLELLGDYEIVKTQKLSELEELTTETSKVIFISQEEYRRFDLLILESISTFIHSIIPSYNHYQHENNKRTSYILSSVYGG